MSRQFSLVRPFICCYVINRIKKMTQDKKTNKRQQQLKVEYKSLAKYILYNTTENCDTLCGFIAAILILCVNDSKQVISRQSNECKTPYHCSREQHKFNYLHSCSIPKTLYKHPFYTETIFIFHCRGIYKLTSTPK